MTWDQVHSNTIQRHKERWQEIKWLHLKITEGDAEPDMDVRAGNLTPGRSTAGIQRAGPGGCADEPIDRFD